MEKEYQVIIKPSVARKLLKNHAIKDIKPNKINKDATVFVFENTEEFRRSLSEIIK